MTLRPTHPIHRHIHSHQLHFARHITPSRKQQERTTSHYIWRTRGDGKVRGSHAANDGKIFSWDNPPETGHPGEDYGCRCIAEPYVAEVNEYAEQRLISTINDSSRRWQIADFLHHFYYGNHQAVTLSEVGHLREVIQVAEAVAYKDVEEKVFNAARSTQSGQFSGRHVDGYPFSSVSFIHGDSTLTANFNGFVNTIFNELLIEAEIDYSFTDIFTDVANLRQNNPEIGTSHPSRIPANELIDGEFGGNYFEIHDNWRTKLVARITNIV
ncbi:MAG: minor capsid protein [Rickettsiales bacterium]|nr:minor capsid protein [Rickettsiales bacterium]